MRLGRGKVQFIELDAENMAEYFHEQQAGFDAVWISEALSHFSNKALFFRNAHNVLRPHGKLVIADWFKAEGLDEQTFTDDIKPIEGKQLLEQVREETLMSGRWDVVTASLYEGRLYSSCQRCKPSGLCRTKGH